ncbi:TetR/AcrR family transcriptional regulator [Nocardia huaxiensis]|uniref:TetR/AcrR family transcriptional regulator n=1 Tax=Nocardia huaxiensis TaxID=2755382 RepID=UPI001E3EC2BC|nr:helix-turn-helix domain-containing protein [Nocardia huaxiensis]UFS99918.1 TetR/AcrR family transcriptional regulator [Nocardia huaxiensis]
MASNPRVDWLAGGDRRTVARKRIETAAAELFLERGVERVSIEDVAARVGCSRATLYRHIGGKTELVRAVMTTSAATVAARVSAEVAALYGSRRAVEAILASVSAIRADPALSQWLTNIRSGGADEYLSTAPELGRIALTVTGLPPDAATAQWIVRIVLALLAWPLPGAAAEREMIERFVAPTLAPRPA